MRIGSNAFVVLLEKAGHPATFIRSRPAMRLGVALGLIVWVAAIAALDWLIAIDGSEQGAIENLQLAALSASGMVWLLAASRSRPDFPETFRALALCVAAACVAGLGRETTWGEIWNWSADAVRTAHLLCWLTVAILLLAGGTRWFFGEACRLKGLRRVLASPEFELLIMGVVCFLVADLLFEKALLQLGRDKLLEESIELFAYALWMAGGLHAALGGRRTERRDRAAAQ